MFIKLIPNTVKFNAKPENKIKIGAYMSTSDLTGNGTNIKILLKSNNVCFYKYTNFQFR